MDRGGYFVHSPRFSTFSFSSLVAQGGDAGWARRTPSALAAEAGGGAPPPPPPPAAGLWPPSRFQQVDPLQTQGGRRLPSVMVGAGVLNTLRSRQRP